MVEIDRLQGSNLHGYRLRVYQRFRMRPGRLQRDNLQGVGCVVVKGHGDAAPPGARQSGGADVDRVALTLLELDGRAVQERRLGLVESPHAGPMSMAEEPEVGL